MCCYLSARRALSPVSLSFDVWSSFPLLSLFSRPPLGAQSTSLFSQWLRRPPHPQAHTQVPDDVCDHPAPPCRHAGVHPVEGVRLSTQPPHKTSPCQPTLGPPRLVTGPSLAQSTTIEAQPQPPTQRPELKLALRVRVVVLFVTQQLCGLSDECTTHSTSQVPQDARSPRSRKHFPAHGRTHGEKQVLSF